MAAVERLDRKQASKSQSEEHGRILAGVYWSATHDNVLFREGEKIAALHGIQRQFHTIVFCWLHPNPNVCV